tara:strand:- start:59106 stop:59690 length:585 start_codon:yes stop_codon:yes gene_type:complete
MTYKTWIQEYIKHPLALGALFPSSASLGSLMVKHIYADTIGPILELGPGTGSFTKALLRKGINENNLVLVEQSQEFVNLLKDFFPKATIVCGDVRQISQISSELGINQFDEIVSGLPLNAMGAAVRRGICNDSFSILKPRGSFVQVSYIPICSIPKNVIDNYSAEKKYCGVTLTNMPPAFVWRVTKPKRMLNDE